MLAELATARARETAERVAFAQATRLTTMGEMAASIAHEVNQPLAAIVANANAGLRWLAHAAPDLSKVQAILQRVVRDGHRASEVVGSVRAMVKRDVQQKAALQVDELIEDVVGLLQTDLESEHISLELELERGKATSVLADRVQLQQVILNLITNAIDAMRASQQRPRSLRITTATGEANSLLISVQDSGAGHRPEASGADFRAVLYNQTPWHGLGPFHLPLHYRGAWWAPVGRTGASAWHGVSVHAGH
jgi:C4-dicarboxylate-specific signal transduction histidine kinase